MKTNETGMRHFISIPDFISLLNMSSGFLSIICALNNNLTLSGLLIILAMFFDSIDGWIARKIGRNDSYGFGKNIDSLSDAISFGAAPAILFYSINSNINLKLSIITLCISLFMVICGVLRLTRYNVIADKTDFKGFIGFPIPGIGFILATFYLSGLYNIYIGMVLMIIVSVLMISNVRYPKFGNIPVLSIALILVILMIFKLPLIYGINIPALILLLITLFYLIRNIF